MNAGPSTENFFQNCPELEELISFYLQKHEYTKVARGFLEKRYRDRFVFISGESAVTVPEWTRTESLAKCDLIYIDGSHSYENVKKDIIHCRELAHENSILWIDDYDGPEVRQVVHECYNMGIIKIVDIHYSMDPCGNRVWIEGRYMLDNIEKINIKNPGHE